ncbi:MAG: hypothetical protein M3068_01795 [Gemmatimonadota bacterium]|nr:hypothetical protein [Gemmatimonadota bacterium]
MRDAPEPFYHRVVFDQLDDAAAFVAALSRYLTSPLGRIHERDAAPSEIWADVGEGDGGIVLYLSDGARAATARGFAPAPLSGHTAAEMMRATCTLVLAAGDSSAYGRDEILRRLTSRCA